MIIPYGLDRLPRDPRVRCVEVGAAPLRLNSEPVPADAMPLATGDHAARVAAAITWLQDQCGDYAPLRRQFVVTYFRTLATEIEAHRNALVERLRPYDGLYLPEDFLWSALRPLPRGWVNGLPADFIFWDGVRVIAIEVATRDTDKQKALAAAGIAVHRLSPDTAPPNLLPRFWDTQVLPSSPFRRPTPSPSLGAERAG